MDMREKVRNDVMLQMMYHLDKVSMDMLGNVLAKVLAGVQVTEAETMPATTDDSNRYILDMFRARKAPKLSPKTAAFYMDSVKRLILYINKPLPQMTSMDIEAWLMSISRDNTPTSLNNQRKNISAFFTWMRKCRLVTENPCESIEAYPAIEKPIDHMEPDEVEQLKTGCRTKRDRALIEYLRSTACRVGEIPGVLISDVDWRNGVILIYGSKGRAYRPVCLDSVALKYLTDYVTERDLPFTSKEPLFVHYRGGLHKPLNISGIQSAVRKIAERAGLDRRVYPHLFRKTTATGVVRRGGSTYDAGEYLGHRDRSVAGRHYAYKSEDHVINIFKRYVAMM